MVALAAKDHSDVQKMRSGKRDKMSICCKDRRCIFRVNVRPVDKDSLIGAWKFTHVVLEHTCDGTARRIRSYSTRVVQEIQQEAIPFVPVGSRTDVAQFQKLAETKGLTIGATVARKIVENLTGLDRMSLFRQFEQLPAYAAAVNAGDPAGRFLVESTGAPGDNRFVRAYMALGYSKAIWPLLRHSCSIDGAGVRTIIEGTFLAAVTLSADDELVLLAIQYCASEDNTGCTAFTQRLAEDFPGIELIFQDAGGALIAGCEAIGVMWRRCVQHLGKNVTSKFAGTPDELIEEIHGLARATTETAYSDSIKKMRDKYPSCGRAIAYIESNEKSFVAYNFIDKGRRSFGQVTNNPVEQSWEFLKQARKLPIITAFQYIRSHFCEKLVVQRELAIKHDAKSKAFKGGQSRTNIVPVVMKKLEAAVKLMRGKEVTLSSITDKEVSGAVHLSSSVTAIVTVTKLGADTGLSFGVHCSYCRGWYDNGYFCNCAVALVDKASTSRSLGLNWSVFGTEFLHKLRTTKQWLKQCNGNFRLIPFSTFDLSVVDNPVLPWGKPPPKPGRKKKKKKEKEKQDGVREYSCAGCGKDGHGLTRCLEKDLDRVRMIWEQREKSIKPKLKEGRLIGAAPPALFVGDDGEGFSSGDELSSLSHSDDDGGFLSDVAESDDNAEGMDLEDDYVEGSGLVVGDIVPGVAVALAIRTALAVGFVWVIPDPVDGVDDGSLQCVRVPRDGGPFVEVPRNGGSLVQTPPDGGSLELAAVSFKVPLKHKRP